LRWLDYWSKSKPRALRARKEVVVGNPLNYALYVTYGTWKMPRRPWFQNSIEKYVEDYRAVVNDALGVGFK